jgi:hypothetical protein
MADETQATSSTEAVDPKIKAEQEKEKAEQSKKGDPLLLSRMHISGKQASWSPASHGLLLSHFLKSWFLKMISGLIARWHLSSPWEEEYSEYDIKQNCKRIVLIVLFSFLNSLFEVFLFSFNFSLHHVSLKCASCWGVLGVPQRLRKNPAASLSPLIALFL